MFFFLFSLIHYFHYWMTVSFVCVIRLIFPFDRMPARVRFRVARARFSLVRLSGGGGGGGGGLNSFWMCLSTIIFCCKIFIIRFTIWFLSFPPSSITLTHSHAVTHLCIRYVILHVRPCTHPRRSSIFVLDIKAVYHV